MGSQSAGIGSALPDQTDQSGKVLVTDGTVASWASPDTAALPVQTGHSGEFLTTDGTDPSWEAVTAESLLPDQTGNSGKVLSTDGLGALSWIDATALALGAFGSTPNADGLTLAAGTLNMEPADGTRPGGVSIAAQTFAGVKTFSDVPVAAGISAPTTSTLTLSGNRTDGGSNIGIVVDNLVALTTAGAKIVSFQNHEVEKAAIDKDGIITAPALTAPANSSLTLTSTKTDAGSAVGVIVNTDPVNVAEGCKWLSVKTGGSEQVYVGVVGGTTRLHVGGSIDIANNFVSKSAGASQIICDTSGGFWQIYGNVANGASAVNCLIANQTNYSTAGAALLELQNNSGKVCAVETNGTVFGFYLKSPNGTAYLCTLADGGTWSINAAP